MPDKEKPSTPSFPYRSYGRLPTFLMQSFQSVVEKNISYFSFSISFFVSFVLVLLLFFFSFSSILSSAFFSLYLMIFCCSLFVSHDLMRFSLCISSSFADFLLFLMSFCYFPFVSQSVTACLQMFRWYFRPHDQWHLLRRQSRRPQYHPARRRFRPWCRRFRSHLHCRNRWSFRRWFRY